MVKGLERSLKQWLVRGLRELLISLKIEFATADICCSVWYSARPICAEYSLCVFIFNQEPVSRRIRWKTPEKRRKIHQAARLESKVVFCAENNHKYGELTPP